MNHINEITLFYKRKAILDNTINTSETAYNHAKFVYQKSMAIMDLKEYFFILFVNNANELISYIKLSEGGINSTPVDIRLAFGTGVKTLASGMILLHNHPSGKVEPSIADRSLTKKFKEAGRILDIVILDHLIVTPQKYYSFADQGLL